MGRPAKQGDVPTIEKVYWIAITAVVAVVFVLWAVESALAPPAASFEQDLDRIVGALPEVSPFNPPGREEVLSLGAANELSTLGRPGVELIFGRIEESSGEEGARWMNALAFYTQKRIHAERIVRFLAHKDDRIAAAAATVLSVTMSDDERTPNATLLLSRYADVPPAVKARIVLALAHLEAASATPTVAGALAHEDEPLRLAAAQAAFLTTFPDETGALAEALARAAGDDPSQRVREMAKQALNAYSRE